MKKIITAISLIITIFALYAIVATGESNTTNSAIATGVTTETTAAAPVAIDLNAVYTIAKLQDIAIVNSRQALADDMNIKKNEMSVRTVTTDTRSMSDSILKITKPMDVKLELEAAQKTKQDNLNQLKVDVYKAAMDILLCEKEVELQEQKLATAEGELTMANARFKAASITQDDLDSAQYSVDDKKVSLANTNEKLNSLYLELKKLLNQPLDSRPIKISGEIKADKFEDIDLDFRLNSLYKMETSVYRASGKLDIAKKALEIAEGLYRKGDVTFDNCSNDLLEAQYNLQSAKNSLEVKVKNSYNDMVNKLNDLELAGKYTNLATKKLDNAKIKYDKGTISKDDYMKAKDTMLDAEYAELSSVVQFNESRATFRNAIAAE